MVRLLGVKPLSFLRRAIYSVLREGLELVADGVGGQRAGDVISMFQRGQQVNNKLTCDRSCAEDGMIYRLVDLR